MWKNWIPFRRKNKDTVPRNQVNGKENSTESIWSIQKQREEIMIRKESFSCDNNVNGINTNGNGNHDASMEDNYDSNSRSVLNRTLPSNLSHRVNPDRGGCINRSFTAVHHGPLLSTPIMPKVRRANESAGLRSGNRPSLLSRGKPAGRSMSLNYGPNNPVKSRAGQVPWVRLKRRESLGLADYISGRTPQSPNTVKLAPPEPSGLPSAPSFRSTPLIVTTEANRSRMLDTQTVVSALREKRKRFGDTHPADSVVEDKDISWQKSPKRRRQDSSQSNASSVSIPSMPDTLPNLIGTPGTSSMIHIEHMSHQRPSTIPAVDMFSTLHKPGLGGEPIQREKTLILSRENSKTDDLNNSRLAQRALQSSLSSSLRARNNLSLLERGGVDLNRIRNSSLHRRASDASAYQRLQDEPRAKVPCISTQAPPHSNNINLDQTSLSFSSCSSSTSTSAPASLTPYVTTVSAPTKRKIAEGVMLRKQNLSMNSPVQPLKPIPSNGMMSASDFEKDKQKEYQRRVLDLLQSEETEPVSTASSAEKMPQTSAATAPPGISSPAVSISGPVSAASSAATSSAISASLDSLNKLVQSTTSTAPSALGTLNPISSASLDKPAAPFSTLPKSSTASSSSGFSFGANLGISMSSQPLASTAPALSTAQTTAAPTLKTSVTASIPASGAGFSFGLQPSASSPSSTVSFPSSSSGFQVNFGNITSSAPAASTSLTSSSLLSTATPASASILAPKSLFSANASSSLATGIPFASSSVPSAATGIPTAAIGVSSTGVQGGFSFSSNQPSIASSAVTFVSPSNAASIASNAATPPPAYSSTSVAPVIQFGGNQAGLGTAGPLASVSVNATKPAVVPPTGGFTFGLSQATSVGGGFQFGAIQSPAQSSSASLISTSSAQPSSFNFAASQASPLTNPSGFNFAQLPASSATPGQSVFGASSSTSVSSQSNSLSMSIGFQAPGSLVPASNTQSMGGFSFAANQPQSVASVIQTQTSTNSLFSAAATNSNFPSSFSQSALSASQPPSFNFGAQNATNSTSFGTATTSSAVNPSPFGVPTCMPSSNMFGATTNTSTANPGVFNFGAKPSTATATPSPFGVTTSSVANPNAFGASSNAPVNKNLFNFGAAGNSTQANTSVFGNATNTTVANPSPFGAVNPTPFGPASTKPSPFGAPSASSSVFSPASTQSIFGASATNSFGTNVSAAGFGSTVTSTTPSVFGASAQQPTNQPFTFGAKPASTGQPAPAFGMSASSGPVFGAANTSASSGTTSSVFGNASAAGSNMFGSATVTQSSVFGGSTAPAFGTSQPASAFASSQSVFGATNTSAPAFGVATTQQSTAPIFGAGVQNPQSNAASPFGASNAFGTPKSTVNPFGAPATTTQASSFVFTGNQSTQNAASPFGTQTPSTASTGGFNFGQATQPASNPAGGFNFSAQSPTPAFQAPNPGGFNFSAGAGATPSFNFSATPSTPNMFSPQTPGSTHRPRVTARRPARRSRR